MGLAVYQALEADGLFGSWPAPVAVYAEQHGTGAANPSSGAFPADLHGIRRRLPDEWAGFLRQHFNSDVRLIRAFFDCDERTARDWLSGRHGVNGAPLLKLVRQVPAARAFFLGEVA